jgi:hypothetical protein
MAEVIVNREGGSRQLPSPTPGGVFLSYRRDDSLPTAARLADDLADHFGARRVYRDVTGMRAGQDFTTQIDAALTAAYVVLVVIGPGWLSAEDADGRRIDTPDDPVRVEIARALETGVALMPVLINDAEMPKRKELPGDLRQLATVHARRVSDDDWSYDLGRVVEALENHGVVPLYEGDEPTTSSGSEDLFKPRRFVRVFTSSRRRAYDAVLSVVEALRYSVIYEDPAAAAITFRPWSKKGSGKQSKDRQDKAQRRFAATAKVLDSGPGRTTVVVELRTVKTGYLASGAAAVAFMTSGIGLAAWPALRMWEKRFARGFLDNVQSVIEGRGIGGDSALLPGVEQWRNRTERV